MRIRKLLSKQRGDTIIEVMLAMSVIGLVLGSSYAIANRSVRIGREAQERTEALKQVETQVERLRTRSAIQDNGLVDFPSISAFCLDSTASIVSFGDNAVSVEDLDTRTGYPDTGECYTGTDGRYAISITKNDEFLFTIRARWEPVGGGQPQELTASYRMYPAGSSVASTLFPVLPGPDPASAQLPEVDLDSIAITDVQETAANVSIGLLGSGASNVTEVGFVIDTSPINDVNSVLEKKTVAVTGAYPANYASFFNGLTPGETYYVRAYAVNSFGTSPSNQAVFVPSAPSLAPQISNVTVQNQSAGGNSSFNLQAEVLSDGNDDSTERGFVYGNIPEVTIGTEDTVIQRVGGGEGSFSYILNTLTKGQEVFVRAYVTNEVATTYSAAVAVEFEYEIGDVGPGGGAIFYKKDNKSDGWKYLEVAKKDLTIFSNQRVQWHCQLPMTGVVTSGSLGGGLVNSENINAACLGPLAVFSPAARSLEYITKGTPDWYLPSITELRQLYSSKEIVKDVVQNLEGPYWSSTLQNPGNPLGHDFDNNQSYLGGSTSQDKLRPVRRF